MRDWRAYILFFIALYFYYNLIISIQKGEIVWKIFTISRTRNRFKFWLTCFCQFIITTLFLILAVSYMFFYNELLEFLAKIS